MPYVWVALGGALGSVARYWLTLVMVAATGPAFPWGTLVINVLGSFVIALAAAVSTARMPLEPELRLFVTVGICGGFTTFSSFSLQTLQLLQRGSVAPALGYAVGSVVLCVLASLVGVLLVR